MTPSQPRSTSSRQQLRIIRPGFSLARLLTGSLAIILVSCAHALVTIPLSLEQLTRESDVIVYGRVSGITVQRDSERRIYSRVELEVLEMWKGPPPQARFTLVHSGGTLGNERVQVTGMPRFAIGEELVAFTVLNPNKEGVLLSLGQGKFRIWRDPVSGLICAANPFHGESAPTPKKTACPHPPGLDHRPSQACVHESMPPESKAPPLRCCGCEIAHLAQPPKKEATPRMSLASMDHESSTHHDAMPDRRLTLNDLRQTVKRWLP